MPFSRPLPRGLKKVLDLLKSDPSQTLTISELAALGGVAPRTLQKHFRRFLGRTPVQHLLDLRFDRARKELLRAPPDASVTEIAGRCGLNHLGRFATQYRERYGESPSTTLRRCQSPRSVPRRLPSGLSAVERPTIAVLPFDLIGPRTGRAAGITDDIATALLRLRWISVTGAGKARYHLRGKIRDDGRSQLRVTVTLVDASTGNYLWADQWDGRCRDAFELEDRVAGSVADSIQASLRDAEIGRAVRKDPEELNAWELAMRALPHVLSLEASGQEIALELLEQAMEMAPHDPLAVSLAAWCHGLRAGHHFTTRPGEEKKLARQLADHAARLNAGDSLTETFLAAGYTLAHDLTSASIHANRALAFDGGSAWAWSRSGWIKAYGGEPDDAIEQFQIARALAPADSQNFLCSIGIAVAHFEAARYEEAIRWYERGLAEHPTAIWCHRSLAPAYALAGRKEQARQSIRNLTGMYPDLTIAQIRSGLPLSPGFLDRAAQGLESAGLPVQ